MPMELSVSSGIIIRNANDAFIKAAVRRCTFEDEKAKAAERFSPWKKWKRESAGLKCPVIRAYGFDGSTRTLTVPRGFPLEEFPEADGLAVADERVFKKPVCPFKVPARTPTQQQTEALAAIYAKKDHHSGCFLAIMPVSSGKTTVSCLAARMLNARTLVLCDTTTIFRGWVSEIAAIYNMPEDAVGVLKGAQKRHGHQFTVAMLQTLRNMSPQAIQEVFDMYGFVVVDEAHISPALTYKQVISKCRSKYMMGVTASARRKDGLESLMRMLFGPPVYGLEDSGEATATSLPVRDVVVHETAFNYDYQEVASKPYNMFLDAIMSCQARNAMIASVAARELCRGRRLLIVCSRRNHAQILALMIGTRKPFRKGMLALAMGGMNAEEVKELIAGFKQGSYKALITTTEFVKKGSSIPQLDTLILTAPVGFDEAVTQLVGRVRRAWSGKKAVRVHDMLDDVAHVRRNFYRNHVPAYAKAGAAKLLYAKSKREVSINGSSKKHAKGSGGSGEGGEGKSI